VADDPPFVCSRCGRADAPVRPYVHWGRADTPVRPYEETIMLWKRSFALRWWGLSIWLLGAALLPLPSAAQPQPPASPTVSRAPIPLLAYYYIWFDPSSWDRAKIDLPELGPYSSDDPKVMRQHIDWAKAAGIDGFIVSWKSTPALNRRMQKLMEIADESDFKLVMIYEGLDFNRNPLPVAQVDADFDYFLAHFAGDKAFQIFSKPLAIWSGTWKFTPDEIAQVTSTRRDRLTILATEKNVADYQRIAALVDGDAYYWSSVNPDTYPNYGDKLKAMAAAIHARSGLWIAPAAPGFDARLVGGTQTVDRKDGATLRLQLATAFAASPDAVGLISWNEFSENSYVEPSQKFGRRYLDVLRDIRTTAAPNVENLDSSAPGDIQPRIDTLLPLVGLAALLIGSIAVIVWRRWRRKDSGSMSMRF
jgi:hypothetical protein